MVDLKKRTWEILAAAKKDDPASKIVDYFIIVLILLNVVAVGMETVDAYYQRWGDYFHWFDLFSVGVFSVEYILRLWSCEVDERFSGPISGRIRFALTPMALIDLVAILPFFLPFLGVDLRTARVLRMMRLMRLAKLGRYSKAIRMLTRVMLDKKEELVITSGMMAAILLLSSTLMYFIEHSAQPEAFSDIPTTMWWAVITLTTVGYGDIHPVTGLGRVLGAVVAILGIGLVALPTGILGSGFIEEMDKERRAKLVCPHCGGAYEDKPRHDSSEAH